MTRRTPVALFRQPWMTPLLSGIDASATVLAAATTSTIAAGTIQRLCIHVPPGPMVRRGMLCHRRRPIPATSRQLPAIGALILDGPDQAEEAPVRDVQVDPRHGQLRPEGLAQLPDRQG